MPKQPDINEISSICTSTNVVNENFENVKEAFDNTLSLDGSVPNAMNADLDMSDNKLLNVGGIVIDGEDIVEVVTDSANEAAASASLAEGYRDEAEGFRDEAESIVASISFASRGLLVTAVSGGVSWSNGTVISDGTSLYLVDDSISDISDLVGLKPYSSVTPNHFGENTTPGTTDMTTAIQAAVEYGSRCQVDLLGETYLISDTITILGQDPSDHLEGFKFRGKGRELTDLVQTDSTKDHIHAIKDNTLPYFGWLVGDLGGFSLTSYNVLKSQKGAGIRLNRNLNSKVSDILIQGPTNAVVSEGAAQCHYSKIFSRGTNRASGETMDSVYTFTDNSGNRSFGNYMSNCEHQAGEASDRNFDISAVDGLYVVNCHFGNGIKRVHIRPDNSEWQTHIYQVFFNNVYWDSIDAGGNEDIVFVEATNSTAGSPEIRIEGLYFINNIFRVGNDSVFRFNPAAGALDGLSTLKTVHFTGNHIKQFRGVIFDLYHQDLVGDIDGIENFEVTGGTIEEGLPYRLTGDPAPYAFRAMGNNIKFQGVTVQGLWEDGGNPAVYVMPDANNVTIAGNVFSIPRSDAISRDIAATNVLIYGNSLVAEPDIYTLENTLYVKSLFGPGINVGVHNSGTASDISLTDNAVVGAETSISYTVESGGHWRWMKDADNSQTGIAGAVEIARLNSTHFETTVPQKVVPVVFASLPSAVTVGAGARHYITDSDSVVFNATAAGGGSSGVGVVSDGSIWKIG